MPTYEFRCADCVRSFLIEDSLVGYEHQKRDGIQCPTCKGAKTELQLGAVEVRTSKKS